MPTRISKLTFLTAAAVTLLLSLVACMAAAHAAPADAGPALMDAGPDAGPPAPASDVTVDGLLGAVHDGKWLFAFGALVVILVRFSRPWLSKRVKWFGTKLGGAAMAFGASALTVVGTDLYLGRGLNATSLMTALSLAWIAAGQWGHAKDMREAKAGS